MYMGVSSSGFRIARGSGLCYARWDGREQAAPTLRPGALARRRRSTMRINNEQLLFGGWGLIVLVGFLAMRVDYFATDWNHAWVLWAVLTLIGFGLMVLTMNLRERTMQRIFLNWVVAIGLGLALTVALTNGQHFELYPYM